MKTSYEMDVSDVVRARKEINKWAKENKMAFDVVNGRMNKFGKTSSLAMSKVGQQAEFAGKKVNRMGMRLQQAGYQVGDFAVQVQGGTNVMVALGQQGAQLLGIFGAGGAIAGAGLAITTALLAPLFRSKKEAKGLVDEIEDLRKELGKLKGFELSAGSKANQELISAIDDDILKATRKRELLQEKILEGGEMEMAYKNRLATQEEYLLELAGQRAEIQGNINVRSKLAHKIQKETTASERQRLDNEISMLQAKLSRQVTSENLKELEMQHAVKAYREDLNRQGIGQTLINQLVEQQQTAFRLANDLERADSADARRSARLKANAVKKDPVILDPRAAGYDPIKAAFAAMQSEDMSPTKISTSRGSSGGSSGAQDALDVLMKSLTLQKELFGLEQDRATVMSALGESREKYSEKEIQRAVVMTKNIREQNEALEQQKALSDTIEGAFENAMMSMVDGTKSVKDAFKSMASEIIKELYRIYVIKKITGMITGALGGSSIPLIGGKANGGPVASGGSYLVGERGPEIFTPSMGGGHITPASQTNAGGVTVVQNINVSTGVQQTVRAEIRQMMPQIAQSAKGAVLDAKRRGGSYGSAFA